MDARYRFDGEAATPTAEPWRLMWLRLGAGPSTVIHVEDAPYTSAFAALNGAGEPLWW